MGLRRAWLLCARATFFCLSSRAFSGKPAGVELHYKPIFHTFGVGWRGKT
jgi:hypothetical protein